MKHNLKTGSLLTACGCVLVFFSFIATAVSAQEMRANTTDSKKLQKSASAYQIPWSVISPGGVISTSGSTIRLAAAANQTAISRTKNSSQWLSSGFWASSDLMTAVDEGAEPAAPNACKLDQNYPNPFNPSTTISYTLPRSSRVTLVIYNLQGQQVRTLVSETQPAGSNVVIWDACDDWDRQVSSGLYLYRITVEPARETSTAPAETFIKSIKMLLLK